MPDIVTRLCPSCGEKVEFADDTQRLVCEHCGAEHVVRRSGTLVSLAPATAAEAQISPASDGAQPGVPPPENELEKLRAEVARLRLERDIKGLEADLAKARGFQAVWAWVMGADVAVLVANWVAPSCAVAVLIALCVGLLAYLYQQWSQKRDTEAVLRRKRSELSQL
jgi:hypothetical protein